MDTRQTSRRESSDARAWARMALAAPGLLPAAPGSPSRRVRHWARRLPDGLAIAFEDRRIGWRELDEAVDRYARWLRNEGVGAQHVVALVMDNRPEFLTIFTALSRVGAVAALINTQLRGDALGHALGVSRAKLVIAGSEQAADVLAAASRLPDVVPDKQLVLQCDAASDRPPAWRILDDEVATGDSGAPVVDHPGRMSDLCCYVYTSGTTGLPKAAVIRNQRMLGGGYTFGHLMHRATPRDLIYVALPLYHSSALFLGWGSALATGAAIGLRRRFSVSGFWSDIADFRATSFLYIGEMCRYLMSAPPHPLERAHGLRVAVGNGMRPDLWEPFQRRFDVPIVREFYGATEGNAPLLNVRGKPGMIGRMQRGQAIVRCELETGEPVLDPAGRAKPVKVGETGLLLGRITRTLRFDGYVDEAATRSKVRADLFAPGDRWFDTGDLVTLHSGGWLSFADRVGDTFRWKGENVSTLEVATVIGRAPGVSDASVYGVRIPGCEGRACMCALVTDGEADLDALAGYFEQSLPAYQRPLFVRLLEAPMRTTSTFKQQTASYRNEGYDPARVADPLYVSVGGSFEAYDAAKHAALKRGEWVPS